MNYVVIHAKNNLFEINDSVHESVAEKRLKGIRDRHIREIDRYHLNRDRNMDPGKLVVTTKAAPIPNLFNSAQ